MYKLKSPPYRLSRREACGLIALGAVAPKLSVAASPYPTRPVRLVVPFPAGGNTDFAARVLAQSIATQLGQPFVVDNKPGAGGTIGVDSVAKAPPDGYSLVYSSLSTYALNVALYEKLPYDPVKDLVPVALTVQVPLVLVVPSSAGISSLADLLKRLRSQPGKHNYASAGNGTSAHIACHLFTRKAGVDVQHIAYKGSGPAITDLVAGVSTFTMDSPSVVNPLIKAGRLTALAVAVPKRLKSLPSVPTFEEAGLPDFRAYSWNAIWAPKGTPSDVLDKLNSTSNKAIADPSNAQRLDDAGVVPFRAMSRQEVARYMQSEYETWVPLVRGLRIKID